MSLWLIIVLGIISVALFAGLVYLAYQFIKAMSLLATIMCAVFDVMEGRR